MHPENIQLDQIKKCRLVWNQVFFQVIFAFKRWLEAETYFRLRLASLIIPVANVYYLLEFQGHIRVKREAKFTPLRIICQSAGHVS